MENITKVSDTEISIPQPPLVVSITDLVNELAALNSDTATREGIISDNQKQIADLEQGIKDSQTAIDANAVTVSKIQSQINVATALGVTALQAEPLTP